MLRVVAEIKEYLQLVSKNHFSTHFPFNLNLFNLSSASLEGAQHYANKYSLATDHSQRNLGHPNSNGVASQFPMFHGPLSFDPQSNTGKQVEKSTLPAFNKRGRLRCLNNLLKHSWISDPTKDLHPEDIKNS